MVGENKSNWWIGGLAVAIGIIILMLGSYDNGKTIIENMKTFAQTLGCSVLLAGVFGIILEWKSTKNYFGNRLREIVLQDDYLKRLSTEELKNLFLSIQKHIFKTDDVQKEGGFLDYFNKHLHGYIVEPYRENVSIEIVYTNNRDGTLSVKDKTTYLCREMNGKIQDYVEVIFTKDEILSWLNAKIKIGSGELEHCEIIDVDRLKDLLESEKPLRVDINQNNRQDLVKVEIELHYTIRLKKLQSWLMAFPTRGFKVSISYPQELIIDTLPLLELTDAAIITNERGYYGLNYNEWMLPGIGISWLFDESLSQKE